MPLNIELDDVMPCRTLTLDGLLGKDTGGKTTVAVNRHTVATVADPGFFGGGMNGECGSPSLYWGMGATPPVGSRGNALIRGSGGEAS